MNVLRSGVDARGFRWSLSALQRQRERDLEVAAGRIAGLEREHRCVQEALDGRQQAQGNELEALRARGGARLELSLRQHALAYLRNANAEQAAVQRELRLIADRLVQARRAATDLQCRLELLGKLRASAWSAYASCRARQDAKEADLAWLVAHAALRSHKAVQR